jgi:iron-sulfur cluster repair protein YtfE (RIC family)
MAQWPALHQKAKQLESKLESKIQKYSAMAQKINADFLCDEEIPFVESKDEQALSLDIEKDLNELEDCINSMRACSFGSGSNHQEVLIKRYHEIHYDYSAEFRNTSV